MMADAGSTVATNCIVIGLSIPARGGCSSASTWPGNENRVIASVVKTAMSRMLRASTFILATRGSARKIACAAYSSHTALRHQHISWHTSSSAK